MRNLLRLIIRFSYERPRAALDSFGLLVLRLGFAFTMIYGHGWGKLMGYSENASNFPDPIGLGGPVSMALAIGAELFCSVALGLGLLTRWALMPLIITMMVAFFVVHSQDPFAAKELALVYLIVYVSLFICGPGRFSLDALLAANLNRKF